MGSREEGTLPIETVGARRQVRKTGASSGGRSKWLLPALLLAMTAMSAHADARIYAKADAQADARASAPAHSQSNAGADKAKSMVSAGAKPSTESLVAIKEQPSTKASQASEPEKPDDSPYSITTAQLPDPLRPFAHLPDNAVIDVRAAVMTIADPLETRLGRAFDVELGAVMSAFQARGYVLDGFAFTWKPGNVIKEGEYPRPSENTRKTPSVLLLRRDDWRGCPDAERDRGCGSSYFVLFLVGETPSAGVHPEAFLRAAKCAIALDKSNRQSDLLFPASFNGSDCDALTSDEAIAGAEFLCKRDLNVIGPAFSGSMESLAAALSKTATEVGKTTCGGMKGNTAKQLKISVLTPSASIDDNDDVRYHAFLKSIDERQIKVILEYRSLALSVACQMAQMEAYLADRMNLDGKSKGSAGGVGASNEGENNESEKKDRGDGKGRVVVLSEESSFGQGAATYVQSDRRGSLAKCKMPDDQTNKDPFTSDQPIWTNIQFPPNIAAIRAEHVKAQDDENAQRRQLFPERLLELDLTGVDKGFDRPPAYQPSLSSRSDELMLFQTFDALTRYVRPSAVIIVATDVRDRIFLLSQIRDALPGALPVVLEQDNLLVHPDYRKISRGSITMPAGRTLVCLDQDGELSLCKRGGHYHYFAFATDYAANAFRAIVTLVTSPDDLTRHEPGDTRLPPDPLVATLAGYQSANKSPYILSTNERSNDASKGPGDVLIAASARIRLQQPIYIAMGVAFLIMLAAAAWIIGNRRDLALATVATGRYAFRWAGVTRRVPPVLGGAAYTWLWLWTAMAFIGLLLVMYRVWQILPPPHEGDTYLAHGRDPSALLELCLGYGCFVAVAVLRLLHWNAHCDCLAEAVGKRTRFGSRLCRHGRRIALAIVVAMLLLACLGLSIPDFTPTSADGIWGPLGAAALVVGGCLCFLLLSIEGYDRWRRITLEFGKFIELVQSNTGIQHWPNPDLLDEHPCSPFNLVMRLHDYESWRNLELSRWAAQTAQLTGNRQEKWCFPSGKSRPFQLWQAQLVAEMKLAAVAVRTCAWCAVLGAVLALVMMQVYPPVYPRLQATTAIALLLLSSAAVVCAVLQLEKDRLLGPMFTNTDKLTLGGALSALWPKLLALGTVLVMLLLPGAWTWLGGLIKAINSLH